MSVYRRNSDIRSWNSIRLSHDPNTNLNGMNSRMRSLQHKQKSIFTLSNRVSYEKKGNDRTQPIIKPQTAPNKKRQLNAYQELFNLGLITKSDIITEQFSQNLDNMTFYPQFKASPGNKKQLLYLKPQIESQIRHHRKNTSLDKIKTQIYKSINGNVIPPQEKKSAMIEYFTQYEEGESHIKKKIPTEAKNIKRRIGINLVREKIKNKCKDTGYIRRMQNIKSGRGIPVTIVK